MAEPTPPESSAPAPTTINFAEPDDDKLSAARSRDAATANSGSSIAGDDEKPGWTRRARALSLATAMSGPAGRVSEDDNKDGIYNMRDVTRTFSRTLSRGRTTTWNWRTAGQEPQDDDPGLQRQGDYQRKHVYHGRLLFWLAYQSVGAIYGDIGTSPLYVYSSTFKTAPSQQDLVGVLSIILWSLALMVTVKYVLIILHADNMGEGGTFSCRYINITNRDPREASLIQMKRFNTGDLEGTGGRIRRGIEHSTLAKGLLKTIGVLAVSMVMSDGILTPAQSVLGAVQGLNVVVPHITNHVVVGTTAGILILLFAIQPLGTSRLASVFAPIVILWLLLNAGFGIYNLARYDYHVLRAFNPGFAFEYLVRTKTEGWKSLGGILLAFTGVEALFADLGAFSMRAIQISWLSFTLPCLILAYSGQAAYIAEHPDAYSNPFFNAVPHGWLIPSLIVAILAAIVASQAIITATFQIKVVHTSKIFHGQLYVPLANWLLLIGTVLVAVIYNNTTSLGNAYGVCVMFVTFFDTCMVSLAAMFVWRISPYLVFFPFLAIACLDGAYLSSSLVKVPDGAWFTITLAGVLAALFILWRFGKEQQWASEAADRYPTTHFVKRHADGGVCLAEKYGGQSITPVKGFGIFFDKDGTTIPPVFSQFVIKLVAAPEVMVLFHLRPLETPTVPVEERYNVSRLAIPNCYRLVVRHGYSDVVINPDLAALIKEQIVNFIIHDGGISESKPQASGVESSTEVRHRIVEDATSAALSKVEEAYRHQVLYIVGKSQLKVRTEGNYIRQALLWAFLWLRDNTRTKIASLKVPTDRLFEVGFVKDI